MIRMADIIKRALLENEDPKEEAAPRYKVGEKLKTPKGDGVVKETRVLGDKVTYLVRLDGTPSGGSRDQLFDEPTLLQLNDSVGEPEEPKKEEEPPKQEAGQTSEAFKSQLTAASQELVKVGKLLVVATKMAQGHAEEENKLLDAQALVTHLESILELVARKSLSWKG